MKKKNSLANRIQGAFSLVEVVTSLAIVSFALLVIVALLPMGLQSTRDTIEETGAVNALSAIIADRQATSLTNASQVYQLPALTTSMSVTTDYFGVASDNTSPATTGSPHNLTGTQYRVDYTVIPPTSTADGVILNDPYRIYFRISWPALAATPTSFVEAVATFPQP
jgi:uncharacterized protein (TIGR02598 family)